MHLVQPDLSPADDAVSYYMNGRFGWVLGLGLIALGARSLALLGALRPSMARLRLGEFQIPVKEIGYSFEQGFSHRTHDVMLLLWK